jgi:ubiquinone/menaquinone biosynthesis C-methylase UbiE
MGFDKKIDAASYDPVAATYDQYITDRLSPPLARHICELVHIREGDRVLDIGTGGGTAANYAANIVGEGGYVLGIDLSEGMIRRANETKGRENLDFKVMDAEELNLPNNSFDAITSLCAVLHFPEIGTALSEMYRVVKPGGGVAVSFGYSRPIAPLPLARHFAKQILRKAKQSFDPVLKAPADFMRIASSYVEINDGEVRTEWSRQGDPKRQLVKKVREAGFVNVKPSWAGHEVLFDSAEEYLNAQMAIVTDVRRALEESSSVVYERFSRSFIGLAQKVLDSGGKLVYPYGAFFVSGERK